MARVTLRLPESLHARLIAESRAVEKSLNEVIVQSLEARLPAASPHLGDEQARMRAALGDLLVSADDLLPPWGDEQDTPLLSHVELQARLPRLDPPLSRTIIDDREDRA